MADKDRLRGGRSSFVDQSPRAGLVLARLAGTSALVPSDGNWTYSYTAYAELRSG